MWQNEEAHDNADNRAEAYGVETVTCHAKDVIDFEGRYRYQIEGQEEDYHAIVVVLFYVRDEPD